MYGGLHASAVCMVFPCLAPPPTTPYLNFPPTWRPGACRASPLLQPHHTRLLGLAGRSHSAAHPGGQGHIHHHRHLFQVLAQAANRADGGGGDAHHLVQLQKGRWPDCWERERSKLEPLPLGLSFRYRTDAAVLLGCCLSGLPPPLSVRSNGRLRRSLACVCRCRSTGPT